MLFQANKISNAKDCEGHPQKTWHEKPTKSSSKTVSQSYDRKAAGETCRIGALLMVPLTAKTAGILGARELALLKSTATLVNISRGDIVDTQALTATMIAKRIFAAALDVTEPEPLPREHPLLKLENVTIAPHVGSATVQTRRRMAEFSVENLLNGLTGKPLACEVL